MLTLHLDIISEESAIPTGTTGILPVAAAFRGERSEGLDGNPAPLAGEDLLEAVREVVWFKDEVQLDGGYAITSTRNLLMFLSDVRTRRFKAGVFLGDDVLAAAETFRAAARAVAAGAYLPHLVEEGDGFAARWLPLDTSSRALPSAATWPRRALRSSPTSST